MPTISLVEAQSKLAELIDHLSTGEEVIITRDDKPVATLVPAGGAADQSRKPRQPGLAKGRLTIISDDDEHLKDFAEYMP